MSRRRWIADLVEGDRAFLLDQNAAHLFRVLRVKPGEQFEVVTGGTLRMGTVVFAAEHKVEFELGPLIESAALPEITALLSIFKFDRMEWALEKLTELGVAKIVPTIAQRSGHHLVQAAPARRTRWEKIVHASAQQSRRIAPPQIASPVELNEAVRSVSGSRIVLSEVEQSATLKALLPACAPPLTMAFGPEGGWSPEEEKTFQSIGWKSASLGRTILRAETAAIAAIAIAMAWFHSET